MGLFGNVVKKNSVASSFEQHHESAYESPKSYTLEDYVVYEQEQTGERWHGVPLSELSKLAQTTNRGMYVKADRYDFLVFLLFFSIGKNTLFCSM